VGNTFDSGHFERGSFPSLDQVSVSGSSIA
jgi:hypothetical protein